MSHFARLLGITAVGTSIVKARLLQRFVKDLANVITLAIASGLLAGALLVSVFYLAYQELVRYGLDPFAAETFLTALAAILVVALICISSYRLRRLSSIPTDIAHAEFPLSSRINGIADSFINGLICGRRS